MLLLVLLVSTAGQLLTVDAANLYGGSMNFNGNASEVEFRIKVASTECNNNFNENDTICIRGDCGNEASNVTVIDTSRDRCLQELVTTRNSNTPFLIRFAPNDAFWYYYNWANGTIPFTMTAQVDLRTRSDTGQSNFSPKPSIIHLLRIHPNCPGTINFTAFDPDGDRVRCSFDPDCNICDRPGGFNLVQINCLLKYNLTGIEWQSDLAFELRVEDFPREQITLVSSDGTATTVATTFPLSSVPLKFTVFVGLEAQSCCAGEFIPLILSPTPPNGAHLPASVGRPLEIRVIALSRRSRFLNLLINGPSGITKSRISPQHFIITWTPTDNEENQQIPICFVVETVNRLRPTEIYQSKLRCVIADVRAVTMPTTTAVPGTTTNTTTTSASATTTVDTTFCRWRPSGLFVNPADPNSFFQCHFGITYLKRCPAGLVYSTVCTCCDFPPRVTPTSGFCEGRADGLFENELDSNFFHHCSNGITITQQCPGNLVYGDGCIGCEFPY